MDSDGDGTADCNDQCATDPTKIAPGVCGCGAADVDSDGDGTADCLDQCPTDPTKTAPGVCGCGVSDVDSDSDGTADCQDQCPTDPTKVSPGTCGCGVADTDSNGNGIVDCLETGSSADLALILHRNPGMVKVTMPIEYTLMVKNHGPDAAMAVTVDFSCSGVPYHLIEAPSGCAVAGSSITCSLGRLRGGRPVVRDIEIAPDAAGVLSCSAMVSSATSDPDLMNNQSKTVDTRVTRSTRGH